jgi:hypothetical protein
MDYAVLKITLLRVQHEDDTGVGGVVPVAGPCVVCCNSSLPPPLSACLQFLYGKLTAPGQKLLQCNGRRVVFLGAHILFTRNSLDCKLNCICMAVSNSLGLCFVPVLITVKLKAIYIA